MSSDFQDEHSKYVLQGSLLGNKKVIKERGEWGPWKHSNIRKATLVWDVKLHFSSDDMMP